MPKTFPVLNLHKDVISRCYGSNYGSFTARFARIEDGSKNVGFFSSWDGPWNDLCITAQWNIKRDSPSDSMKLFEPYAFEVGYRDTNLQNFENRYKGMKKIKRHLSKVPATNDFGIYVYEVCRALKVRDFIYSEEGERYTRVFNVAHGIKDLPNYIHGMMENFNAQYKPVEPTPA